MKKLLISVVCGVGLLSGGAHGFVDARSTVEFWNSDGMRPYCQGISLIKQGLGKIQAARVAAVGKEIKNLEETAGALGLGLKAIDPKDPKQTDQWWILREHLTGKNSEIDKLKRQASHLEKNLGLISEPDPFYGRSEKYIFLKTTATKGFERLECLYTPFGRIQFGCFFEETGRQILEDFKKAMSSVWKTEEVTGRVLSNHLTINQKGAAKIMGGSLPFGAKDPEESSFRLFLVKGVGPHTFVEKIPEKMTIFSTTSFLNGQPEKDKALFKRLSEEANTV